MNKRISCRQKRLPTVKALTRKKGRAMTRNKLYTIGFTKVSAEVFFGKLRKAGVRKIIDIRLNNESQLAGFAKKWLL